VSSFSFYSHIPVYIYACVCHITYINHETKYSNHNIHSDLGYLGTILNDTEHCAKDTTKHDSITRHTSGHT
jgi:hypothetical protein